MAGLVVFTLAMLTTFTGSYGETKLGCVDEFKRTTRMMPCLHKELLDLVRPLIQRQDTNWRRAIKAEDRLSLTIRYLAHGDSVFSLHQSYLVAEKSVLPIVRDTCRALYRVLHEEYLQFAGLMDISEKMVIDGFGFCGVICVAPNMHEHVNKTLSHCDNTMMTIRNETWQQGHLIYDEEHFYNFAIKRQGSSRSRMCKWAHGFVDGCMGKLVKEHCDHDGIKRMMNTMMQQTKAYICSQDPPVLECAFHPEVLKNAPLCAAPLKVQFGKYFNGSVHSKEEQLKQFQRFYNGEIKNNNGESLYNAFKTLGTCLSNLIGQGSVQGGCSKVKELIDAEIDKVIAYFKKTDMLTCNFDPELWGHMEECGVAFSKAMEDRALTHNDFRNKYGRYNSSIYAVGQFRNFADNDYQLLKTPLKDFTTCVLRGMNTVCGKKWTYNVAETQLTLLENIFNPKEKSVPEHCEALIKEQSSSASISQAVVINVAVAVLLRVLMMA